MSVALDLQNVCDAEIPSKQKILKWIDATLSSTEARKEAELTIRVVDKEESQQLNQQYRNKSKPTNVLSFPFEMPLAIEAEELLGLLGDLVICAEIVKEEAQIQEKNIEAHWAHMCIHGLLHLLGYDHIEPEDADKMESIEIDLLSSLGYADPYQIK